MLCYANQAYPFSMGPTCLANGLIGTSLVCATTQCQLCWPTLTPCWWQQVLLKFLAKGKMLFQHHKPYCRPRSQRPAKTKKLLRSLSEMTRGLQPSLLSSLCDVMDDQHLAIVEDELFCRRVNHLASRFKLPSCCSFFYCVVTSKIGRHPVADTD